MVWISMYRELLTHPKLRKFMRSSGLSRNEAAGTLFSVWAWGVDNAERNGMILEADRRDIADVISAGSGLSDGVKPSKVVDSMVESGWIDELDGHLYKESSCTGSALSTACRLVGADVNTVIATAKAMNRFEKRERWQVCAHLPTGWCSRCGEYGEDRVRRFFASREWDADYFQSTGRRHPWAA